MPAGDSPAILVARFLQANQYDETLKAFLSEAGLPPDAGSVQPGYTTIEKVLEEKKAFDLSSRFEKLAIPGVGDVAWSKPCPEYPTAIEHVSGLANILHVSSVNIRRPLSDSTDPCLVVTTASKGLFILSAVSPYPILHDLAFLNDSPVLSSVVWASQYLLITCMSGKLSLINLSTGQIISERRDHTKYATQVIIDENPSGPYVATAGYDKKIHLYRLDQSSPSLSPPFATITLPTNPVSILFLTDYLLLSRLDSTKLQYYSLPTLDFAGSQNLAPHSNAWLAFTPSSLALSPIDDSLIAVATSSVPYMKILFVKLLLPTFEIQDPNASEAPATQATQAQAQLAIQDREANAIRTQISAQAPQTAYSTPRVVWRPDGSGVWVNGDDGVVRGVEGRGGKVLVALGGEGGHLGGTKVRNIWAGTVGGEEWCISGGFDKKVIVWRPAQ
ncbi:MAG: hypothetical protein M1814_003492 [Vezdaea aestivalis]|nr:MAG: hypothetical protein M1814_003492 [Vezdaea aestivalis]